MDRQTLIETIYDSIEFPHSERAIYSDVYYAFLHAMNMTEDDQKMFFKWLISPSSENFRLTGEKCTYLSTMILDSARLDILETMSDYLIHLNEVAQDL